MRILVLSDIHGKQTKLETIVANINAVDLVCIAGDFTTHGTVSNVQTLFHVLQQYTSSIVAVAGNMDSQDIDRWLDEQGYGINSKGKVFGKVGISGVSAAPLSILHTPYEVSEKDIEDALMRGWKDIQHAERRIILSHTPPHKTNLDRVRIGMHVGSTALRKFIEEHSPDLVLCGHIHEAKGTDRIGNTILCNCGSVADGKYALVEINESISVEHY